MNRRSFLAAVAASPVMPAAIRLAVPCEHKIDLATQACARCGKPKYDIYRELMSAMMDDMEELLGDSPRFDLDLIESPFPNTIRL